VKVERTRGFGAEVVLHGETFDEAHEQRAASWPRDAGPGLRPPLRRRRCRSPARAPVALEMLRAQPRHRHAGGRGGRRRAAVAAWPRWRARCGPDIRIVGVQTARFASMVNAVTGSAHPIGTSSIAEGIAVGRPGELTRAIAGALRATTWHARRRRRHRAGHRDAAGDREDGGRGRGRGRPGGAA
jgi:threonine dehydratase